MKVRKKDQRQLVAFFGGVYITFRPWKINSIVLKSNVICKNNLKCYKNLKYN